MTSDLVRTALNKRLSPAVFPKNIHTYRSSPTRGKTSDPWIASLAGGGESGNQPISLRADTWLHGGAQVALIDNLGTLAWLVLKVRNLHIRNNIVANTFGEE